MEVGTELAGRDGEVVDKDGEVAGKDGGAIRKDGEVEELGEGDEEKLEEKVTGVGEEAKKHDWRKVHEVVGEDGSEKEEGDFEWMKGGIEREEGIFEREGGFSEREDGFSVREEGFSEREEGVFGEEGETPKKNSKLEKP